jgi:hypothetical protein
MKGDALTKARLIAQRVKLRPTLSVGEELTQESGEIETCIVVYNSFRHTSEGKTCSPPTTAQFPVFCSSK